MTRMILFATACAFVLPAHAGEKRELGSHEHGVGSFNIAFEGTSVAIELESPGADIVGFEHPAESDADRAAIEAAETRLADPLSLFVPPAAAGCTVASSAVALIGDDHHDEHGEHGEHEAHADHDDHGHEHADHDDHDDHAEKAGHTEFHATYMLTCTDPSRLNRLEFAYFEAFPNAEELEVQMIGEGGTAGFEVTRDQPVLEIPGNI